MNPKKLNLKGKSLKIVKALLNAPIDHKGRIKLNGEPIWDKKSKEPGWVTSSYLRKGKLIGSSDQNKLLVQRLSHLIGEYKIYYLDKKKEERSAKLYRIKRGNPVFKNLFNFFYKKNLVWEFILSNYCRFNVKSLPLFSIREAVFTGATTLKKLEDDKPSNKKDIIKLISKADNTIKQILTTPPSMIYSYLNDEKEFNQRWSWYKQNFGSKLNVRKEIAEFYALLCLDEAFWTRDYFDAQETIVKTPPEMGINNLSPKKHCREMLSFIKNIKEFEEKQNMEASK